jgi:1,4-alpha-glucan branching enzyme
VFVIVAALVCGACAAELNEGVRVSREGVRFRLRQPAATSVAVSGDFNGWSHTAHPMTRSGEFWTCVVTLPPGEHVFMYVVDGVSWVTPPNAAEIVPDGFGGWNGKVFVP